VQKFLQKADSLQVAKTQDLMRDCSLQRLPSYTSLLKIQKKTLRPCATDFHGSKIKSRYIQTVMTAMESHIALPITATLAVARVKLSAIIASIFQFVPFPPDANYH